MVKTEKKKRKGRWTEVKLKYIQILHHSNHYIIERTPERGRIKKNNK